MLTNSFYRQNQNTFDAVSIDLEPGGGFRLTYAYTWRQYDVFFRAHDMDSHAAQAVYSCADRVRIGAYASHPNYRDHDDFDRRTTGVRVTDPWQLGEGLGVHYTVEYAHQVDIGGNPFDVDAGYLVAELGVVCGKWPVYAGYNHVEGAADPANQRPFDQAAGYPYPYRGETEQFVVTPAAGMNVLMLRALGPVPGVEGLSWLAHPHHFAQESGDLDYGLDLGLSLNYSADPSWSAFVKAARFAQDDVAAGSPDTTRFIFGAEHSF